MSAPHDDSAQAHEGPIKTPRQLIWAVFFAFVIPIVIIVLLANYVTSAGLPGAGSAMDSEQAVAQRLQPVARLAFKDAASAGALKTGEQVYKSVCFSCHDAGTLGAPKLDDAAAWAPRLKAGFDALVTSALKGKNAMPPQAGGDHSDIEIARAVAYMANHGGAKFAEPAAPAASGASAAQ